MELILVVVISAGMAGNSQNGVSRSLSFKCYYFEMDLSQNQFFALFDAHTPIRHYVLSKRQNCFRIKYYCIK